MRRTGADEAEVVVVTDLDTDDDTPEMYRERARLWLSRKLPMICANPDRVVEHGDKIIYCGGALGDGLPTLTNEPVVRCDEAAIRILGLSLAGWNAVVCAALAAVALKGASRHG